MPYHKLCLTQANASQRYPFREAPWRMHTKFLKVSLEECYQFPSSPPRAAVVFTGPAGSCHHLGNRKVLEALSHHHIPSSWTHSSSVVFLQTEERAREGGAACRLPCIWDNLWKGEEGARWSCSFTLRGLQLGLQTFKVHFKNLLHKWHSYRKMVTASHCKEVEFGPRIKWFSLQGVLEFIAVLPR